MRRNILENLLNLILKTIYIVYLCVVYVVTLTLRAVKDILQNIYERIIKYAGRVGFAIFVVIVIYISTIFGQA